MAVVEEFVKKIDKKLGFLSYLNEETEQIMQRKDQKEIERQSRVYETKVDEIQELKIQIQELKLEEGEIPSEVKKWRIGIEERLKEFQPIAAGMKEIIESFKHDAKKKEQEVDLELERQKFEQRLQLEAKLVELKGRSLVREKPVTAVKLPKLSITKFKGTHIDWFRFWNQFETEVDKQNLDPVTKFNYLKEFIEPKVRINIENLIHNGEGYERAKQILKSKYGRPSEVINAHVQCIIELPVIRGSNPHKIHDFFNKLLPSVQALESLGRLKSISGYTRLTLDKLEGIRADLVRLDDQWQEWGFPQLIEALSKWTERNPLTQSEGRDRMFTTRNSNYLPRSCVYCEHENHKSSECKKVVKVSERREILRQKRLCFNCTSSGHKASVCTSKGSCRNCRGKHHTSVCDKVEKQGDVLLVTGEQGVVHPVVIVKVEGVLCRALLDTGAGSSYVSSQLIEKVAKQPIKREQRQIDMMMSTKIAKIEIYNLRVESKDQSFSLNLDVSKVNRKELLTVPNPNYGEMTKKFSHLKGVYMEERSDKEALPIHLIIGASDYAKIKTPTKPRVGKPGEPVAELTGFGWTIMSPGYEIESNNMFFAKSALADFDKLCSLDVLGIQDKAEKDIVIQDFKDQLERSPEGWYRTGLLWKSEIPDLPDNEQGSKSRLKRLVQRLERQPELYDKYEEILLQQEQEGIIEKVTCQSKEGRKFYLPHRAIVRESAESTKVRIVFDASARANDQSPSLNDCLETGPPLQNLIWDILARNRLQPITLCADMKQAFLQIRIKEQDRDVLRFHWLKDRDLEKLEVYRFTRVMFGCSQSPFLLCATVKKHLEECRAEFPEEVSEIERSIYVDDLLLGGSSITEVQKLKESAIEIFDSAKFTLHKLHSNRKELETDDGDQEEIDESFAKQQLGTKAKESKLLGLTWDKQKDTIAVSIKKEKGRGSTKRELLQHLASIYDPLGIISPITLVGKIIFRDACKQGVKWDEGLPKDLNERFVQWSKNLPERVAIPRSIPTKEGRITSIELHVFGDASIDGVAAIVYAVIRQESEKSQGLLVAKSRLAKNNLTIPRLELVAAHMAANLVDNVVRALEGHPIENVYAWLDSTVALHWVRGENRYKQFVSNRVSKIKEKDYIVWRHVPSELNPADIASRGSNIKKLTDDWFRGPDWIQCQVEWPKDIKTTADTDTELEAKPVKEILKVGREIRDVLTERILEKYSFLKAMKVTAWLKRFAINSRLKKIDRRVGPLTTAELQDVIAFWIRKVQGEFEVKLEFKETQKQLGLEKDEREIYVCKGRIQGEYPIFLPTDVLFSEKLVSYAHLSTHCGGSSLTMAKVREDYWIPRLRKLAKGVIKKGNTCKRFNARPVSKPKPGLLPEDRTEGTRPFEVVGVDYAGPISHKTRKGEKEKHISYCLFAV
ncbi:uncharacterized protein LOC135686359 [Rhopilema esculentum]|uniref:uncharacterized protein LOC135686359 n=1 Tax=Rhopilema esculentum TaxID=499914 RepID=UPI0031DF45F9